MDLFPDGAFVQLRSRANRKYVHADGDWEGVSLRSRGSAPSLELEAVWQVEHWVHQGTTFLRLQGAAYGRYLSLSAEQAPPGHRGLKAVQCDLDEPNMVNIYLWRWRVERVHPLQDYVRLRHFDRNLRANGRFRPWNTRVTVEHDEALERRGRPTQTGAAASPSTSAIRIASSATASNPCCVN